MKTDCDVIRDLLPLYTDEACSEKSRDLVNEHLQECPACQEVLRKLQETEIENDLRSEKKEVIEYGIRRFKRRSAAIGSAVSGSFMIPILICLYISFVFGTSLNWIFIVMAALCVAASLIVVPLPVPEDKIFWTFCAFTASLILLLGVACAYSHGDWFEIAASAVIFGLSVVFLPFLIRARPVRDLIGDRNRLLLVLGVDFALFFNLLTMIDSRGHLTLNSLLFSVGTIGGIVCVIYAIIKNRKTDNHTPYGKS